MWSAPGTKRETQAHPKQSKRGNDKDGKKVIIGSRQNDEGMASAQISALPKSMEQVFSWMAKSLTTALTLTKVCV